MTTVKDDGFIYSNKDVELLIDLSKNIFECCRLMEDYPTEVLDEIKELLVEGLHLEREEEHQSSFFGFNGLAINHFLDMSYGFLGVSFDNNDTIHKEFIATFKKTIKPYVNGRLFY